MLRSKLDRTVGWLTRARMWLVWCSAATPEETAALSDTLHYFATISRRRV